MNLPEETIQIRGELGADLHTCRFLITNQQGSGEILPGGSHVCTTRESARGNVLLEALFAIEGITQVWVAGNGVTLQKFGGSEWPAAGKLAGIAIREFFARGKPYSIPAPQHSAAELAGLAARVREVLDIHVNPGVAGHGGKIELMELKGSTAYLKMSGGCQGCGAAKMTLKQGVEKALRANVPEITEVIDITDHSAGRNPFYAQR